MFYWAKEFASALPSGGNYAELPRTMILSILDFTLFPDLTEYHSFFQPLETTHHTLMSDKMGFHFFELPKLPDQIGDEDELLLWLALFNANTEEELEQIRALEVPDMEQAINAYYMVTASPEFQELERIREKARHDGAQALYHAAKMEHETTLLNNLNSLMKNMNLTIEQAMSVLNVPETECLMYKEQIQKQ